MMSVSFYAGADLQIAIPLVLNGGSLPVILYDQHPAVQKYSNSTF